MKQHNLRTERIKQITWALVPMYLFGSGPVKGLP